MTTPITTVLSLRATDRSSPTATLVPDPTPCLQAGIIVVQFAQYVPYERVSDILIELGLYWSVSGISATRDVALSADTNGSSA